MRLVSTLLVVLLVSYLASSADITTGRFGSLEITNEGDDYIEKEIYFPDDTLYYDDLSRAQFLRTTLEQSKSNALKMLERKVATCEDYNWAKDDDFSFFPVYVGSLFNSSHVVEYKEGTCFKSMKFTMEQVGSDSIKVTVEVKDKRSLMCREALFLSTTSKHHLEHLFFSKKHTYTFKNLDSDDIIDLNLSGLRMY